MKENYKIKVVILAGGMGTRIREYTKFIPKPMIKIKGLPILVHIMNHFAKFGFIFEKCLSIKLSILLLSKFASRINASISLNFELFTIYTAVNLFEQALSLWSL